MSGDAQPQGRSARPTRVLVVEDEPEVLNLLTDLLARHGYEVMPARNGVAAMVALTAPEPDGPQVVLLDLGLPLEGGASVLSFLRNVVRSGIPVVILTGRADMEEERTVRALGVSDYLHKPASPHQILSALSTALIY
jgi:DNA-binding response OmpR family regulator